LFARGFDELYLRNDEI